MGARGKAGIGRLGLPALVAVLAALLLIPAVASAATLTDENELGKFGEEGSGAGQLRYLHDSAADPVTGHLYVADDGNNRIDEFTPWGDFVKAFGWDVAPGAVNEQQEVRVRAGAGSFKLDFEGSETADLPFDATGKEVEEALDALASIGGAGGEVGVEEALGKAETATPFVYVVAFKGSLAGKDVVQLTAKDGAIPLSEGNPETELEVRTRAQGTAGGTGLESCTTESGCQTGSEGAGGGQFGQNAPNSLAVDGTGRLYVLESRNLRVQRFSSDGSLLDVYGGDVVAHGPDDSANYEQQEIIIAASGGTFRLGFEGQSTPGGLEAGDLTSGSPTVTSVLAARATATLTAGSIYAPISSSAGRWLHGQPITGAGIPAETTVQGIHGDELVLSNPATVTEKGVAVSASGPLPFAVGETISGPGIPAGTTVLSLGAGTITLSANATAGAGAATLSTGLPYDASAAEVEAALNALASIGGAGGEVSVTGGPGDATGSVPYEVSFGGDLAGDNVPSLTLDEGGLAEPADSGYSLECGIHMSGGEGEGFEEVDPGLVSYQWLRNGAPIAGATAKTYTTTAADEGKAVQCQGFAIAANTGDTAITTPARIVSPAPAEAAPVPPSGFGLHEPYPSGKPYGSAYFAVGNEPECLTESTEGGGNKVAWPGATSFTYAWYRNGVLIPGATSSTYVVTAADVATPGALQCVITGANAEGTAVSMHSEALVSTNPKPLPPPPGVHPNQTNGGPTWARMRGPAWVRTVAQGGGMEICSPASGDVCKAGRMGWGTQQLGGGGLSPSSFALATDGTAFVSEGSKLKAFGPGGAFEGAIETSLKTSYGIRIARDPVSGDFYAYTGTGGTVIQRLDAASWSEVDSLGLSGTPGAFTVDAEGDLFVVAASEVSEFDPEGHLVSRFGEAEPTPSGKGNFAHYNLSGLGTNALGDLYVSNHQAFDKQGAFIRAFGPGPVSLESPPLRPPDIAVQYAASVGRTEAELRAKINPHFWNDTTYRVQYGTAPCAEGGCEETPEALLTKRLFGSPFASQGVFLEGLEPGTTYHYRFVSESTGGGPAYGPDRTFTTYRDAAASECPANETFRSGASAALPDCRAYEMVSPPDKEGGDIVALSETTTALPTVLNQSAAGGGRFAYGSYRAFGDAESSSYTTQYIAGRKEGVGWTTHAISPPREERLTVFLNTFDTEFKAFSPDLCEGWLETFAEPPLAPEAPAGYVNLYRRTDSECGGPSFEALNTATPSAFAAGQPEGASPSFDPELMGLSEDGQAAIFLARDRLSEEAPPQPAKCVEHTTGGCKVWLYASGKGAERFVCTLPGGNPYADHCFAGGALRGPSRDRDSNLTGAISADGAKAFWTASDNGPGKLYLRTNPTQAQSAVPLGYANGTGTLSSGSKTVKGLIAAKGKAAIETGSKVATLVEAPSVGRFVAGQLLNIAGGIPSGTSIVSCSPQCGEGAETLTLSNAATATKETTLVSKGPEPFAAGQRIAGVGIPLGTTITEAGAGELTLSAAATISLSGVPLEAWGQCSEAAKACTYPVSEVAEAEAKAEGAEFQLAAKDGSRVLFMVGKSSGSRPLYEFRPEDESTHLIADRVLGLVGASKDATRVYLDSEKALTGTNAEGRSPTEGKPNLYLYEGGTFRFIGTLASDDRSEISPIGATPITRASRVSADGLHAAFGSYASLTGYDNTDAVTGETDAEVYRYDASGNGGEGKLTCASCNPGAARPRGVRVREGQVSIRAAAHIPVFENNLYASRALSEDGTRLFFDAQDALVPADTNGRQDVYEWEAPGSGGCSESSPSYSSLNEGCVDLISSGQSKLDSEFLDASPSGNDVFFTTLSSFVGQDFGLVDVYDARVDGGLPEPPEPAPSCEGEACQGTPEAPNDPTPASETFEGAGNVVEGSQPGQTAARCPKGKVKRRGRCVRKPRHCAKGKVKRHGKCVRKHKRHTRKHKRRAHHGRRAGR